ncbi:MAG: helix-turn-helix domain-containing protein [Candidatus Limnocylindrales bacterium]
MPRPYALRKRAETTEATRQRIIDATIGLHQEVGGARTTVAEIARRAGTSRLTVYRHFPDERSLLAACTGHYMSQHRPPEPSMWAAMPDPEARLTTAIRTIYRWFADNEVMMSRADEDVPTNPVLAEVLAPKTAHWDAMRDDLDAAFRGRSRRRRAAIGHALAFSTWRSLRRDEGLDEEAAVEVMRTAIMAQPTDARSRRSP